VIACRVLLYLLEVGLKMLHTNTMQKSGEPAKHRFVASDPNAMYQGGQAREEEPGKNYMQPLGMLASPKRFIGHSLIRPTNHGYGIYDAALCSRIAESLADVYFGTYYNGLALARKQSWPISSFMIKSAKLPH